MPEFYMIVARKYQKKIADYFFSGGGGNRLCTLSLTPMAAIYSTQQQ